MQYSDKLLKHFRNPRNVGEIEDADGIGHVGNPMCGDILDLYIKVKDDRIIDAKFQTYGCAAAIGTSSALTEMVVGKTISESLKITNQLIAEAVGGVPLVKRHCSVLAEQALKSAIKDYQNKLNSKNERQNKK